MDSKLIDLQDSLSYIPSFWEQETILKPFDFLILGSGLVGKQCAIALKKKYPNSRIGIIDRFPFSYGASTRNAGFACFGSIGEWLSDSEDSSTEDVLNLAYKRFLGIQKLLDLTGKEIINYKNFGGYEVFKDQLSFEKNEFQIDAINQLLIKDFKSDKVFKTTDISKFNTTFYNYSIYNDLEGQLHSGKLIEKLEYILKNLDVQTIYGCQISNFEHSQDVYELISKNNIKLKTQHLIVANNAFAKLLIPDLDIEPARGQVMITKPIENLKLKGNFHFDNGYIYFRTLENRLLIGGARNLFKNEEQTFHIEINQNVQDYLNSFVETYVLPNQKFEIESAWSGIMAMGKTKFQL